jgi:NADPH-dependent curcumin reductase CurA
MDICKPKAGETVVVSGACRSRRNACGGQIAKLHGRVAVGIAGTDEKQKH